MGDDSQQRQILEICELALAVPKHERSHKLIELCQGNEQLLRSAETILNSLTEASQFLNAAEFLESEDLTGTQLGNFQLTSIIGQGGMGTVYQAERTEGGFSQTVAIKVVRGLLLGNELRRRFNAERQILANLDHPYIARLLDGGTTADNAPYLVMEYVDGQPLTQYCDEHRLSIPERIELLRKVAIAVHAAHQNLVIHRDIKPSNVLVTDGGIPKLLDFGIAKLIRPKEGEDDHDTTMFGQQALTPNYASPEQIMQGRMTTISDVYSLGVVAYELLSGCRPYDFTGKMPGELIKSVSALSIPRASTQFSQTSASNQRDAIVNVRRTSLSKLPTILAGDLDNVLLKALDPDPTRRYPSAQAFGEDLRRFQEGKPVEAVADTALYRLRKFVARNRVAVGTATTLFLIILGSLGFGSWAFFRAEAARLEATTRFTQVREIANTLMFDVYDEVSKLGGATRAREKLAQTAQLYLESLSVSQFSSPDVRLDAGLGYARLGDVLGGVDLSLGDRGSAMEHYEQSLRTLEELNKDYPNNPEFLAAFAEIHGVVAGHALYSINDVPLARKHALESIRLFESLPSPTLENFLDLTKSRLELADTHDWDGEFAEAEKILSQIVIDLQTIDTNPATHPKGARMLAKTYRDLGDAQYYLDQLDESVQSLRKSRDIGRELLETSDDLLTAERSLALTLFALAGAENDHSQEKAALESINEALKYATKLHLQSPEDRGSMQVVKSVTQQKSIILSALELHDEAIAAALESLKLQEQMNALSSDDQSAYRGLTTEMYNLGETYRAAGQLEPACHWLSTASERFQIIEERGHLTGFDASTTKPDTDAAAELACSNP